MEIRLIKFTCNLYTGFSIYIVSKKDICRYLRFQRQIFVVSNQILEVLKKILEVSLQTHIIKTFAIQIFGVSKQILEVLKKIFEVSCRYMYIYKLLKFRYLWFLCRYLRFHGRYVFR